MGSTLATSDRVGGSRRSSTSQTVSSAWNESARPVFLPPRRFVTSLRDAPAAGSVYNQGCSTLNGMRKIVHEHASPTDPARYSGLHQRGHPRAENDPPARQEGARRHRSSRDRAG